MTFKEMVIIESLDSVVKKHREDLKKVSKDMGDFYKRDDIIKSLQLFKKFLNSEAKKYFKTGGTSTYTREFNTLQNSLKQIERDLTRMIDKMGDIPVLINLRNLYGNMVDRTEAWHRRLDIEYNELVMAEQRDFYAVRDDIIDLLKEVKDIRMENPSFWTDDELTQFIISMMTFVLDKKDDQSKIEQMELIYRWQYRRVSSFEQQLLDICTKADKTNLSRLEFVFPFIVGAYTKYGKENVEMLRIKIEELRNA